MLMLSVGGELKEMPGSIAGLELELSRVGR